MKHRYSFPIFVLGLVPAAVLAGVFCAETAAVSAATQADGKNEKPVLKIVNESGKQTTISAENFAKLPRQTVKAKDHSGALATYEGVALVDILRAAKTKLGKDLKGPLLANCVLVEAADNYRVIFSLVEIDPEMGGNLVLVADRKDGKVLDDKEGPYRLVVPADKGHARWVRRVNQISVRPIRDVAATKKDK